MPAKAPIYLKPGGGKNGHGNGKGGKKLRELLSTDMISPPLGDFRHMAHVGRGGSMDMFGDTSFLQVRKQKNASSDNTESHNNETVPKVVAEGLATMRRNGSFGKKSAKKQRNLSTPDEASMKADVKSLSTQSYDGYGPAESPILQTAFSLPLLNQEQSTSTPSSPTSEGGKKTKSKGKKTMNNNCISNGKTHSQEKLPITSTPNVTVDGPPKPRRIMSNEEDSTLANGNHVVGNGMPTDKLSPLRRSSEVYTQKPDGLLPVVATYSDSTSLSEGWELDLGESLMDDVMGIMDRIEL
uniref:Cdc42 effector protein 3 n=1 Tax=Phallusia mammillata TaxID=59560 RepID=A0A6F9D889_9ASCI|nr:cdc42 effector protein 3 [Phallusia mammillata]